MPRATSVLLVAGALVASALPALSGVAPAGATSQTGVGTPIPASVLRASAAPGHHWRPDRARYGVGKTTDQSVRMRDGKVLRADVYYPTTNGKRAKGPFPVALTLTPYGKGVLGSSNNSAGGQTGPSPYLVQRGFIDVVVDVRGTGASQGQFGLFDPQQDRDGATLVRWAARRANSDGKVGMYGASYLGIDQLLTAAALPKGSPLKAIFPVVPGNDLYKDTATMGGLVDIEFDAFYLALTGGLNTVGPLVEGLQNPSTLEANLPAEVDHLKDLANFDAKFTAQTLSGGASAYDGKYWHARNPVNVLNKIAANGIPAYMVGGEYDLFQRGEPLDFTGLQNAWAGRSVTAPMSAAPAGDRPLPAAGRAVHASVRIDRGAQPVDARVVRHVAQGAAHRHGNHADAAALLRPRHEQVHRARALSVPGRAPDAIVVRREQHADLGSSCCRVDDAVLDAGRQPVRTSDRSVVGRRAVVGDRLRARRDTVRRRRRLGRAGRPVPDDLHDRTAEETRDDRRAHRRHRQRDGHHQGHRVGRRGRGRRTRRHVHTADRGRAARLAAPCRHERHVARRRRRSCCRTTRTRSGTRRRSCPAG